MERGIKQFFYSALKKIVLDKPTFYGSMKTMTNVKLFTSNFNLVLKVPGINLLTSVCLREDFVHTSYMILLWYFKVQAEK